MLLKLGLFLSLIFCVSNKSVHAQTNPSNIDTVLIGDWSGTSICQVKNSPCHDESVVFHISKNTGVDTFYINASKIVNGIEQGMGILPFVYDKSTNQLTGTAYGIWTFKISKTKLEGTMLFHGELYRKITVYKIH
jgi:hypothetical protein